MAQHVIQHLQFCSAMFFMQHMSTVHTVQVVGVSFLMLLKQQGIPGSILADEMGLGKTAQAICFLGMFIALVQLNLLVDSIASDVSLIPMMSRTKLLFSDCSLVASGSSSNGH